VSLASLRGRVVLLNIWATWCHPCREEIPVLQALHERNAARGLEVVGVSVDAGGEDEAVAEFARDYRMTYPAWRDPDGRVSTLFAAVGVPATYLVGRDGTLLWRKVGPIAADDPQLARALEEALAEPAR
jgi:cytochrome c-type biogenesis protein